MVTLLTLSATVPLNVYMCCLQLQFSTFTQYLCISDTNSNVHQEMKITLVKNSLLLWDTKMYHSVRKRPSLDFNLS
jgi:hypothetical protein